MLGPESIPGGLVAAPSALLADPRQLVATACDVVSSGRGQVTTVRRVVAVGAARLPHATTVAHRERLRTFDLEREACSHHDTWWLHATGQSLEPPALKSNV
jgi:hypothetical protein